MDLMKPETIEKRFVKSNILLCVSGGIAAYKAIELCSMLQKDGYQVKTILTDGAKEFISPINFSAISHNSVHSHLFSDTDPIPHINLADWADLILVAPATANVIAKAANGLSDDLLSATLLAATSPVLFVPAMNVYMYEHPATQANIQTLKSRGALVLEPDTGMLACGYEGKGKYPPNKDILQAIKVYLNYTQDLTGKRIMITAGATLEAIDPMRVITNLSSGKMGIALASIASLRGADVTLIYGDIRIEVPYFVSQKYACKSAQEMYHLCMEHSKKQDWIFKCAAVADFTVRSSSHSKIKKEKSLILELVQNPDILAELGKLKPAHQLLIGFAAETEDLAINAANKMQAKNLDYIIANHLDVVGRNETKIEIIGKGKSETFSGSKTEAASAIIDRILADV